LPSVLDVVYKIGSKPNLKNYEELRYSIRSLKNIPLRNIFIIGKKPDWITGVIHHDLADPYKHNKDANLINKILFACTLPELGSHFLNMSDDQYILKPMTPQDFVNPPESTHLYKPQRGVRWYDRAKNTMTKSGFTTLFEAHCPYMIEKSKYAVVLNYDYGEGVGMLGNTLYFNSIGATPSKYNTTSNVHDPGDYSFLNLNAIKQEEFNALKKLFPQKSRFEL
jgi:hypothetical protein